VRGSNRLWSARARPHRSSSLSAFESIASPDQLKRAVGIAVPLCFLDMAARYHRQRPSIVRLHPWMRDLVPQTLRLALSRL
jgi:hypothetical protein